MTIFGCDISSYQHGLDLSRLAAASFVIAKTTEGTYYTDPDYDGWRRQAAQMGKPFIWYHFLSGEDAHAQAAHTLACVGDPGLPGMLDVEPTTGHAPTIGQALAYIDAAHAAGLNLRLIYLPRWVWQNMGSPDLTPLAARGVQLVASAYPGGSGAPQQLYPGDAAAGWEPYGGMKPLIYQYTDRAVDAGQPLDYNAFRGTVSELVACLQNPGAAPDPSPTQEDDVPAFSTGPITPGAGEVTMICPPPANLGSAGWGNVWFSLGSDFGEAHVRVAIHTHGAGWSHIYEDVAVPASGDRVNPFGGPLPAGVQKISVARTENPDVPLAYLLEAVRK